MDTAEPTPYPTDAEETRRGVVYIYGLGFFFGFFLLITVSYVSYICKRRVRSRSPPPPAVTSATTANYADNNHQFIRFSRGFDDGVLLKFPTFVYSEVMMHHKGEGDASRDVICSGCSICLADYKPADIIRLLPECGHLFHVKCIDTWLKVHPTCPVCRNSLLADMVTL